MRTLKIIFVVLVMFKTGINLHAQFRDTLFTNAPARAELYSATKTKSGDILVVANNIAGEYPNAYDFGTVDFYLFDQDLHLKKKVSHDLLSSRGASQLYNFLEEDEEGYVFSGQVFDFSAHHVAPYLVKLDHNLDTIWYKPFWHPDYVYGGTNTTKADVYVSGIRLDSTYIIASYCEFAFRLREVDRSGVVLRDTTYTEVGVRAGLWEGSELAFATANEIIFRDNYETSRIEIATFAVKAAEGQDQSYIPEGKVLKHNYGNKNWLFMSGAGVKMSQSGVSDTSFSDSSGFRGSDLFLFRFDTLFRTNPGYFVGKFIKTVGGEGFDTDFQAGNFDINTKNEVFLATPNNGPTQPSQCQSNEGNMYNQSKYDARDNSLYLHKTNLDMLPFCSQQFFGGDGYNHYPRFVIGTDDGGALVFCTRIACATAPEGQLNLYAFKIDGNCQMVGMLELGYGLSKPTFAFPNPASNELTIALNGQGRQNLLITDLTGRIVLEKAFSANETKGMVDVSNLPNGVYLVENITGTEKRTQQLVIAR